MAALTRPPPEKLEEKQEEKKKKSKREVPDDQILSILYNERQNSIGFENGWELQRKREKSLNYAKGYMPDMPSLTNRSQAVSTDTIDAIETVMPDLMEIFTGGEDVATFDAQGEEDEKAAKQETDYVNYVAFRKLPGFMLLYTAIKDALQVDTGILKTWWEDNETDEEEDLEGVTVIQVQKVLEDGAEIVSIEPVSPDDATMMALPGPQAQQAPPQAPVAPPGMGGPPGMPPAPMDAGQMQQAMPEAPPELFNIKIRRSYDKGCIKSAAVDPQNFSVSQDTIDLATSPYKAIRSYPRAQSLLDAGFDPDKVAELSECSLRSDDTLTDQARDLAAESSSAIGVDGSGGPDDAEGKSLMRMVEIHEHWIRADFKGKGKSQLWHVTTDADCDIILDIEEVDRSGVSAGTPFINTHRFYGMSLAEKLFEIQKIKTALLRLMLDSGYFAMNQRVEVAEERMSKSTIQDLMRNEPGIPIRSKTGDAIRPITAGQLGFDPHMALEYTSTMAEQRSGVVRNAQGINPDTLHDTAKGAMALMTMAQKRIRMIARVLAETLIKGWFLDIHALSRKHATRAEKIRLNNSWVDIDPSTFGDRADMTIDVGLGSGGRDMELAIMGQIVAKQLAIFGATQGQSPVVKWTNIYNALKRFCERAGLKAPDMFFSDPAEAEQAAQGQPPPPNPDMIKVQGQLQLQEKESQSKLQLQAAAHQSDREMKQLELQSTQQLEQQRIVAQAQSDAQANQIKAQQAEVAAQREFALKQAQLASEAESRRYQIDQEITLSRDQKAAELAMNERIEMAKIAAGVYTKPSADGVSSVHLGGAPGA